jgi:hypothetical protein
MNFFLLIRVIFILQQPCHNVVTVKKHYERLDLMVDYP